LARRRRFSAFHTIDWELCMKPFSTLMTAVALAAGTLMAAAPAHAVGRLVDVQVMDRDSGQRLPVYSHEGQWWVAGRPGARYAIAVRNATGARVESVMSVDGVNIISGDTADWAQTGYVLPRWQSAQITGWRKSDDEVAQFHFTALPKSYAARTGRPDNVGVIGVAVYREKTAPPPPRYRAPASRIDEPLYDEAPAYESDYGGAPASPQANVKAQSSAAPSAASMSEAQTSAATERARRAEPAAPRLGTGHGARESSHVEHTRFIRSTGSPQEVITIRYDSRENLLAMGIIPSPPSRWAQTPQAFPQSPAPGYTPDPPAWR
jgi:hypothetical protein